MALALIIFIQYLISTTDGIIAGLMLEIGNSDPDKKLISEIQIRRILPFWAMEAFIMALKVIAGTPTNPLWLNFLQIAVMVLLLRIVYHHSWFRVMIWITVWFGTAIMGELPGIILFPEIVTAGLNWTRENRFFLLVFAKIIEFVLMVLAGLMIRRKKSFGWKDPQMLIYLGLAAGIAFVFPTLEKTSPHNQMYFLNAYIPFTAIASLVVFGSVTAHWLHARFRMNIEKTKLFSETDPAIEEKSGLEVELAKIRHDAGNITSTISWLLENGGEDEAGAILESLSSELKNSEQNENPAKEPAEI